MAGPILPEPAAGGCRSACRGCGQLAISRGEPPRYDVLNPDADQQRPNLAGPYCASGWPDTVTGRRKP